MWTIQNTKNILLGVTIAIGLSGGTWKNISISELFSVVSTLCSLSVQGKLHCSLGLSAAEV